MSKIKLLFWFKGVESNGKRIAPGVYSIDDPALCGLGEYFVRVRHAVVVDTEPAVPPSHDETTENADVVDLDSMTKAELVVLADERGIDINTRDAKAVILDAVRQALS